MRGLDGLVHASSFRGKPSLVGKCLVGGKVSSGATLPYNTLETRWFRE